MVVGFEFWAQVFGFLGLGLKLFAGQSQRRKMYLLDLP